jgi:hypothetical protein
MIAAFPAPRASVVPRLVFVAFLVVTASLARLADTVSLAEYDEEQQSQEGIFSFINTGGCDTNGVKCKDVHNDPKAEKYCSLCGPTKNTARTVTFYPHAGPTLAGKNSIVQIASSVPVLSTLVTALIAGKLTTALSSAGPFTVFASTNDGTRPLASFLLPRSLTSSTQRISRSYHGA